MLAWLLVILYLLVPLIDRRRRALNDRLAGTTVACTSEAGDDDPHATVGGDMLPCAWRNSCASSNSRNGSSLSTQCQALGQVRSKDGRGR